MNKGRRNEYQGNTEPDVAGRTWESDPGDEANYNNPDYTEAVVARRERHFAAQSVTPSTQNPSNGDSRGGGATFELKGVWPGCTFQEKSLKVLFVLRANQIISASSTGTKSNCQRGEGWKIRSSA